MRKLVYVVLAAALILGIQLLPARRAEANSCWWLCCIDDGGCTRCCEDGPCPEPSCPVG